jgi:hypothetical protein
VLSIPERRIPMSPIGRIFTVLNLILAAAFLGWASNTLATSKEWKDKYEGEQTAHEATRQEKDEEISSLRTAKEQAERNASLMREERDREKLRGDQAENEVQDLTSANSELRASVTKISESLDELRSTNERLGQDKDRAIQAQHEAEGQRDDAQEAQLAAELAQRTADEARTNAERRVADLELELGKLGKERDSLSTQLQTALDITNLTWDEITGPPLIPNAVIVQANYETTPGLVAINKGENDGVKRGMTFHVYKGSTYKGDVRVEEVQPTRCFALVRNVRPGQTISQGDSAATRL